MDIETRLDLIKSDPTEEIVTEEELRHLLETKEHPKHYIGFEISGMPHIGHVLVAGKKINDLAKAGVETQILLADWHTVANEKLHGDWELIIKVADFYKRLFKEVCPKTKIILGSDLYKDNDEYWKLVMKMASKTTIARATRTLTIMGRSEKDTLHVSQYVYPIMQAADIHAFGADIPHAGIDQRRVHMLAKELFKEMSLGTIVPIHHHLLGSLLEPPKITEGREKEEIVAAMKMSKSKPGSAISILAAEEEVKTSVKNAWCPEGVKDQNPVLELCKYIVIPSLSRLKIERPSKFGGDVEYTSYQRLEEDFTAKKLHPMDLKGAVGASLSALISPISKKFSKDKEWLGKVL